MKIIYTLDEAVARLQDLYPDAKVSIDILTQIETKQVYPTPEVNVHKHLNDAMFMFGDGHKINPSQKIAAIKYIREQFSSEGVRIGLAQTKFLVESITGWNDSRSGY